MKIVLGTFKDNADELADFLGPRLGTTPEVGGGELNFDDEKVKKTIKAKHVKTYVKRFLNRKGERANYQIQVSGKELKLIQFEREEEEEEKKTAPAKEEKKEPEKPAQLTEETKEEAEVKSEPEAAPKVEEAKKEEAPKEKPAKKQAKPKKSS
jgi:hypothetical protein